MLELWKTVGILTLDNTNFASWDSHEPVGKVPWGMDSSSFKNDTLGWRCDDWYWFSTSQDLESFKRDASGLIHKGVIWIRLIKMRRPTLNVGGSISWGEVPECIRKNESICPCFLTMGTKWPANSSSSPLWIPHHDGLYFQAVSQNKQVLP